MDNTQLQALMYHYRQSYWLNCPWMLVVKRAEWAQLSHKLAGCYRPQQQCILLNQEMLKQPGMEQAIGDTLLHELIHVWQRHHPDHLIAYEPQHGKGFRSQMYRLNGLLGREAITIYHDYRMPGHEAIVRRAIALLARTQSDNEHEASIAVAKFTAYLQRYDLKLSQDALVLAQDLPEVIDQVVAVSKVADSWRKLLLNGLAYINATHLYWRNHGAFVQWHMIGREHRLDQVVLVYDYLEEAIERLIKKEQLILRQQGNAQGRSYWNAFRVGMAHRIQERLISDFESRKREGIKDNQNQPEISALMVQNWQHTEQKAVSDYIETQQYRFRTAKGIGITNATGYVKGKDAGDLINLSQQLHQDSPKLLTEG